MPHWAKSSCFQFVGYNDDILDVQYTGPSDSHIAVATNSEMIKVFEVETWDCQILRGHSNTVMCLDVLQTGFLLASGSKVRPKITFIGSQSLGPINGHSVFCVVFATREAKPVKRLPSCNSHTAAAESWVSHTKLSYLSGQQSDSVEDGKRHEAVRLCCGRQWSHSGRFVSGILKVCRTNKRFLLVPQSAFRLYA